MDFIMQPKEEAMSYIHKVFPKYKRLLDDDVIEHSDRVCDIALFLADEYGFNLNERIEIGMGSILHDIGKAKVDGGVLNKSGRLSENEMMLVERHPHLGYKILKTMAFPQIVSDIAHQHHEYLDGSGYLDGLTAKKIDIRTQIVTVADMFEAMTAKRVYHDPIPPEDTIMILRRDYEKKINQTAVGILAKRLDDIKEMLKLQKNSKK